MTLFYPKSFLGPSHPGAGQQGALQLATRLDTSLGRQERRAGAANPWRR
jgi:hypothetical protein